MQKSIKGEQEQSQGDEEKNLDSQPGQPIKDRLSSADRIAEIEWRILGMQRYSPWDGSERSVAMMERDDAGEYLYREEVIATLNHLVSDLRKALEENEIFRAADYSALTQDGSGLPSQDVPDARVVHHQSESNLSLIASECADDLKPYFTNDMGAAEAAGIEATTVLEVGAIILKHLKSESVTESASPPAAEAQPDGKHKLIPREHYHVNTLGHISERRCACPLNTPPNRYVCAECVDSRPSEGDAAPERNKVIEECARAICEFCRDTEHNEPPALREGSERLWHRHSPFGWEPCQATAIRVLTGGKQ